jgi:cellulose synthase/poly-beta-1,6-N-acetylglucosamine synthase-like glycosyltransferase
MIFAILLLIPLSVMVAYMIRHLAFTYMALFGRSQQFIKSFGCIVGVYTPEVTVLIPCHNEERVIGRLLQRMAELTYPKEQLQVLVIDDGSTDRTGKIADLYACQFRFITVIHKPNGGEGKAAALNVGLKFSIGKIVLTFDADYIPQLDIIEKLVAPFIDPDVGAVQGRIIVLNENDSIVSKIVALERIGGYRVDQQARDELCLVPQYGGTVGGFRRDLLDKVEEWDTRMLAEDTDLTMKIILQGQQVRYIYNAGSYEEAVNTWRAYWNQRYRWAKGHMQCTFKYMKNVLKAKHLSRYEKTELVLLLCVYFVPLFMLAAWLLGVAAYLSPEDVFGFFGLKNYYFFTLAIFTYSAVGNFAPFFEIGIAIYLDDKRQLLYLLPVLAIAFVVMVFCCTVAFFDLLFTRNNETHKWNHTKHNGNGFNSKAG